MQGRIAARISDVLTLTVLFFIFWMIDPKEKKEKRYFIKGGWCIAGGMVLILTVEKISQSYPAYLICFVILAIVYSKWIFNISVHNSLLVSIFYIAAQFSLAFVEEWIVIYFCGKFIGAYRSIVTQLLICLFFVGFRRLFRQSFSQEQHVPMSYYTLVIMVSLCSLIVKERFMSQGIHHYMPNNMKYLGTIAMLLFVINLLIFYLYSRITADRLRWMQTYTLQMRYEQEQKVLEEITLSNQVMSQRQHNFKQHIFTIKFLADGEEYEELKQYCKNLLHQSWDGVLQTGNPIVNAIVSQKKAQAQEKGVNLKIESDQLPISLPIENIDLSVLIGNLIDNAVEACCEMRDAQVELTIKMFPGYLAVRVTNPVRENIGKNNPKLYSTKKNRLTHGWGIPSIRMIAEKYSGEMSVEMTEKKFQATVILFWKEISDT